MLTHQRLLELLTYDPDTGEFSRNFGVQGGAKHSKVGTLSDKGTVIIGLDRNLYSAHRLAWFYVTGEWPRYRIKHRNNNKEDNRFCNLEEKEGALARPKEVFHVGKEYAKFLQRINSNERHEPLRDEILS